MDMQILMKDMKVIPKELFRRADGEIYDEAAEQDQGQSGHGEGDTPRQSVKTES